MGGKIAAGRAKVNWGILAEVTGNQECSLELGARSIKLLRGRGDLLPCRI